MKVFAIKCTLTNEKGKHKVYFRENSACVVFNTADDILYAKKFRERKDAEKTIASLEKRESENNIFDTAKGYGWKFELVEVQIIEKRPKK